MEDISDVAMVRTILEQELKKSPKVHKLFVIEEIKDRFNHIKIVNKIYSENRAKTDGLKNFNAGAKKIFRDSWYSKSIKKDFDIDSEGFIEYKTKRRKIEFDGESKTFSEWADSKNIPYDTLKKRFHEGWTIERALSTPLRKHNKAGGDNNLLLSFIADDWIEKDVVRNNFLKALDEEAAISYFEAHQKTLNKTKEKLGKKINQKVISREQKIKRGGLRIFRIRCSGLITRKILEVKDSTLIRKCQC
jgi:hypothetical protein